MYIHRTLSQTIQNAANNFPVILVTGPRQVGKTTLLENSTKESLPYVTLDDLDERAIAKSDPALFLQKHQPPVIIDEVQYAPELFSAIKIIVDKYKKPGLFWLTGSQKFHLMQGITESLAGRVAIIDMLGLSQAESENRANSSYPFLPTKDWLARIKQANPPTKHLMDVYRNIWLGGYPRLHAQPHMSRDLFYKSYIQTYIQRDVRDLTKVGDESTFLRFLKASAARTGQLINYSEIARDVGIDFKTAQAWLSILEASGIIYLLQPYFSNVTKRIIKSPKLYFLDTGLCSYLTQWPTADALEAGAMSGQILETYILSEILKSYWHNGQSGYFYFYRDTDQKEIDLIIENGDTLYPIEFKKTATPSVKATKSFKKLSDLGKQLGHGAVICLKETDTPLSNDVTAIPVGYL